MFVNRLKSIFVSFWLLILCQLSAKAEIFPCIYLSTQCEEENPVEGLTGRLCWFAPCRETYVLNPQLLNLHSVQTIIPSGWVNLFIIRCESRLCASSVWVTAELPCRPLAELHRTNRVWFTHMLPAFRHGGNPVFCTKDTFWTMLTKGRVRVGWWRSYSLKLRMGSANIKPCLDQEIH